MHTLWHSLFLAAAAFALLVYPPLVRAALLLRIRVALPVLWTACAIMLGYTAFRSICSMGLTCDVGGDAAHRYYLMRVFLPRTILQAAALALATGLIWWRVQRRPVIGSVPEAGIGAAAVLLGWTVTYAFAHWLHWLRF